MATHPTVLDVMFDLANFPPLSPLEVHDQWAFENDDSMRAVLYQEYGWSHAQFCLHYLPWLRKVTIRHLRRRVESGEYTRVGLVVEMGQVSSILATSNYTAADYHNHSCTSQLFGTQ